jgi:hypothetical protein
MPNHYAADLLHTLAISGLSRMSTRACCPRNFMKITQSRGGMERLRSGEIDFAVEKLRLSACLIGSVRG